MSVVTLARYRTITGDTASASGLVEQALADAQQDLEEDLDRPLESAERTERLRLYSTTRHGWVVYPRAHPITDAGDLTIAGAAVYGASPLGSPVFGGDDPGFAEVTYTGGYTTTTVPRCIEQDIAWAAHSRLHPTVPVPVGATAVPVGATAVSLGDASVSFGPGGARGAGANWSRQTMRYRRRHQ